ncbi:MAG: YaaL family protein [Kyrpidia sp.]|nr:YaaL family protein [Kyrpidia sp.]
MKPIFRWARCKLRAGREIPGQQEKADLLREIERTRDEWMRALHLLDNVVEPELIDHAIYTIQAAQRKYEYLMRVARSQQVQARSEDPAGQGPFLPGARTARRRPPCFKRP